jgi:hypothetical protein
LNINFQNTFVFNEIYLRRAGFHDILRNSSVSNDVLNPKSRGYHYWAWKPFVVREAMRLLPEHEILLYIDAGAYIHSREMIHKMATTCRSTNNQCLFFENGHNNQKYTTQNSLKAVTRELKMFLDSNMVDAACFILVNNVKNRQLIDSWFELCLTSGMLDDATPSENQNDTFIEHRHDQALLSICLWNQNILIEGKTSQKIQTYYKHRRRNIGEEVPAPC